MTLYSIKKAADEMGIPLRQAIQARLRFLMPQVTDLQKELHTYKRRLSKASTSRVRQTFETAVAIEEHMLAPLKEEADSLLACLNGKTKFHAKGDEISPEMIEKARKVPFEQILEVKVGRSKLVCCPFHKDKEPSASIKNNFLICFAGCSPKNGKKGWDTISFLMERDGISFRDAVQVLCQ